MTDQVTVDREKLETLLTAAEFGIREMDNRVSDLIDKGEYDEYEGPIFDATHAAGVKNKVEADMEVDE